jgi:tetratricopeptide (TPR) repeat protein
MVTTKCSRQRLDRTAVSVAVAASLLALGPPLVAEGAHPEASAGDPACDVTPDERAMAAAKGAFEAGNAAFNEADYRRAITYWEDAYRRDCTAHPMLKNLARAYELDGQYANAILALETYLARQPSSGDEASIRRRIEALEKRREEDTTAEPVEPTDAPVAPPPPKETPPPPPLTQEMERSPVPLYVAGAGAVVGIVGGALWYQAYATVEEIDEQCPVREDPCPRGAEGNQARNDLTLWGIVGGVGGAVAVGGLVWYFVQSEQPVQSALAVEAAPGYAGVSYSGSFDF